MKRIFFVLSILMASHVSRASDGRFTVVRVDPASEDMQMFWRDERGSTFKRFDPLSGWLRRKKKQLIFGMNAGMYHPDFSPVGLLVLNGVPVSPLNLSNGAGNFFLKPNGVFLISKTGPRIVETSEYLGLAKDIRFATQSGPLLVRKGVIHPSFNVASTSRLIRNGVGVSGNVAIFVISDKPVSFYEFAIFFRDTLHCQDALYLDGTVSSLYSVDLQRNDQRVDIGPIVGVIR